MNTYEKFLKDLKTGKFLLFRSSIGSRDVDHGSLRLIDKSSTRTRAPGETEFPSQGRSSSAFFSFAHANTKVKDTSCRTSQCRNRSFPNRGRGRARNF